MRPLSLNKTMTDVVEYYINVFQILRNIWNRNSEYKLKDQEGRGEQKISNTSVPVDTMNKVYKTNF